MAVTTVNISEKTADAAKKVLSRSIDKKVWLKENKPESIANMSIFEARLTAEMDAYEELRRALLGENDANT